jgi:hypothetical protein
MSYSAHGIDSGELWGGGGLEFGEPNLAFSFRHRLFSFYNDLLNSILGPMIPITIMQRDVPRHCIAHAKSDTAVVAYLFQTEQCNFTSLELCFGQVLKYVSKILLCSNSKSQNI